MNFRINFLRPPGLLLIVLVLIGIPALTSCNRQPEESVKEAGQTPQPPSPATTGTQPPSPAEEPPPPMPPISETFDGTPQLSLFPRIGGNRPADDDSEQLGYWKTFIEHLQRTSGIARGAGVDGSDSWSFRGNEGVNSLGFFSPLAVKPQGNYRVTFDFRGDLPEKGEAGVGVLEFKEFLWIGDQFTEKQLRDNLLAAQVGIRLEGKQEWATHNFDFTVSPATGMVHLILFREGEQSRVPVYFDNIHIEPVTPQQPLEK